jgi:hypothetical protein
VLAHYSNGTHVSDEAWSKLLQDSWNIWMSLPIDDRKLMLETSDSVSSITEASSSTPSRGSLGRGRRTFTGHCNKRKVMFMDQQTDTCPSHHGPCKILETPRDYDAFHPHFAWLPTDIIKKTFKVTTQYARMPLNTVLCKCFKSPNPAVNIQ